jgi:hypothetical protein
LTCSRAADLAITLFTSAGRLTWTNSVSNATYRIEWAGTAEGPWQRFDALTHLTSIAAASTVVTVQVPMCDRVVWLDAPAHAGTYRYSGYEEGGGMIVAGNRTGSWSYSTFFGPVNGGPFTAEKGVDTGSP